jgi:arylsulfatase
MGSAASYLCLGPGWSSAANTPLRRHKTWVHEGGISTSFIAHWPKGIAAKGELRHTPAHLIDVAPTVLEMAGCQPLATWEGKAVPPLPGKSLLPAFAREVTIPREFLWWQHEGNRALRMGDWKIVAADTNSTWELYNLKVDRGESDNLATKDPGRLQAMAQKWQQTTDEYYALARQDVPAQPPQGKGEKKKKKQDGVK